MKRGFAFLALWLVTNILLAGVFIPAIPPGGVGWPCYILVGCVPLGAFLYARFPSRPLFAIAYWLLAGAWFGVPLFYDERSISAGRQSIDTAVLKVNSFAIGMALICFRAFVLGGRMVKREKILASPMHKN